MYILSFISQISEFFDHLVESLKFFFQFLLDTIAELLNGLWEAIAAAITNILTWIGEYLSEFLKEVWVYLASKGSILWEALAVPALDLYNEMLGSLAETITDSVPVAPLIYSYSDMFIDISVVIGCLSSCYLVYIAAFTVKIILKFIPTIF